MAEKPFLKLGPKDFLTGIASSAHTNSGGLFFKADGITPLYDAGGTASPENGLLQAGATPTDFTASVVIDSIIGGLTSAFVGSAFMYLMGSNGNFYQKGVGATSITNLRSGPNVLTSTSSAMVIWGPANGTTLLYYWQNGHIGTWDLSGTYPTGWNDSVYSTNTQQLQPLHKFVGNVYYSAGNNLGALEDAGSGSATHTASILDFPTHTGISAIGDDGVYLVIASTDNPGGQNFFGRNKIYFWDTYSVSWSREYEIIDPFIWGIQNIGSTVYAFGQYGIYEGSFGAGFKKIISRQTGFGTTTRLGNGYGINKSTLFNNQCLMFATDTTIDTYGKLQPDVPVAYLKPFKIPSGIPTAIFTTLDVGRVYVATDTPKLYAFDFNGATHDSGNTAQTVYLSLPEKVTVHRIDLVFGEPLSSGDAIQAGIYTDQDTAVVDYGSATFAVDGATRRKSLYPLASAICEDQLSLLLTYTSGAVKLKSVEFYGKANTP